MPSKREYPKYAYDKAGYIVISRPLYVNSRYEYFYFTLNDINEPGAWGTRADYESWWDRGELEVLQLKHILQFLKDPFKVFLKGQKKEFIIAFINDLIEEIKAK